MVNWHTVMLPKNMGGMGLAQMKFKNQAILAKLCWKLANEQDAPWANMLAKKDLSTLRLIEEGKKHRAQGFGLLARKVV